jgi:PhoH-like ATPase
VILCGPAGAAKTFLSLAAGLDKTRNGDYERIYISRNNITGDEAFGYLPGDLEDKMRPLIAPFRDNLVNLIKNQGENEPEQIEMEIDDLFETKMIDLCPMAYIRGRSITNSFVILDEAQHCDRSGIRDLITRAGEGTKIVLLGDTSQIDARNLDKWSNGLIFASNKFRNNPLCAQITFSSEECVRSDLAKAAIDILAM